MLVAAVQLTATPDATENATRARDAIGTAAARGARLIVLPELFLAWPAPPREPHAFREVAQPLDGPFVTSLREVAREAGVWVVCGIIEVSPDGAAPWNTTVMIDERGGLVTAYRKTHLFDALGNRESDSFAPGDTAFVPTSSPIGCVGLMVCYELRFPEIARSQVLRGAQILVVPAAWVFGPLKEVHWRTLVLARAIENTCYVVAAGQCGNEFTGRSLVVDPMGVVLAEGGESDTVLVADIAASRLANVGRRLPCLAHRRPELYC